MKFYFYIVASFILSLLCQWHISYAKNMQDLERLKKLTSSHESEKEGFDLPHHDFSDVNLDFKTPTSFKNSNLSFGKFINKNSKSKIISHIDFSNSNLQGADFSGAIITKCKFDNANLEGALFQGATIKFTSFNNARLQNTNFISSNQESVGYTRAILKGSDWSEAKIFRLSFTRADERGMIKNNIDEQDCSHEHARQDNILSKIFD